VTIILEVLKDDDEDKYTCRNTYIHIFIHTETQRQRDRHADRGIEKERVRGRERERLYAGVAEAKVRTS